MRERAYVIAEYDPFHNGHFYHINETRRAGADEIAAVMSPNFVQRGEIAAFDKSLRTRAALTAGIDLVIENPLKFVLSGASQFASGAMKCIERCGGRGVLSFGAGASVELLTELANTVGDEAFKADCRALALKEALSYPRAVYSLLKETSPEEAEAMHDPNNVLALEYINASRALGLDLEFFAVIRKAAAHDAEAPTDGFASGKWIRETIYSEGSLSSVRAYLPDFSAALLEEAIVTGRGPVDRRAFSALAMTRLEGLSLKSLAETNGVRQGLENRIREKLKEASDLQTLYDEVKTKRFVHSRIRQSVVSAVLGIKRAELAQTQPYLRILGFDEKGREMLRGIKESSDVPVVLNLSEAPSGRARELDRFAGRLYEFCRPVPKKVNAEYALKPVIVSASPPDTTERRAR